MKPFRSILAAVDLGASTRLVLGTADALARAANARLHVVHALEFETSGFPKHAATFQALVQRSNRALQKAIERWAADPEPASVELIVYSQHKTIVRRAERVRADLIVIGVHGRGRALLGTTADRVLRTATCPVWIAQRALRLPMKRIVVASDYSPAAKAALTTAAHVVQTFGGASTEVTLVHVYNPALQVGLVDRLRRRLEDEAAGWVERNGLSADLRVRVRLVSSQDPARGLARFVRRSAADLLVLGTHGRGAIDRLLLGSVAARILREPACNTIAVPPQPADAALPSQ